MRVLLWHPRVDDKTDRTIAAPYGRGHLLLIVKPEAPVSLPTRLQNLVKIDEDVTNPENGEGFVFFNLENISQAEYLLFIFPCHSLDKFT